MRREIAIALMAWLTLPVLADEPAASAEPAAKAARASATREASQAQDSAPRDTPREPLDLRVGDVRDYMMPNEYRAAVSAPDADKTDIIVQGERPAPPLQSTQPLPTGPLAIWSLFRHPTRAWRLFLPDPNRAAAGPPPVVPPPEFRWGP